MRKKTKFEYDLWTLPFAAKQLNIAANKLRAYIENGIVDAIIDGRTIKVPKKEILKLKIALKNGEPPDMSGVPDIYRIRKYQPVQRTGKRAYRKKTKDDSFESYFNEN